MFTATKNGLHQEVDRFTKEAGVKRLRIHDTLPSMEKDLRAVLIKIVIHFSQISDIILKIRISYAIIDRNR